MMKLLFASDSFKGSLSSEKTIELLSRAAEEVFGECEVVGLPVADGGEGTVDAVIRAEAGYTISVPVHDPLMSIVDASYGVFDDTKAIIEMSAASGLTLVPEELRNPWETTSYGTGELIRHALESGYREIYIAIGGSATNDGGMGCVRALGVRFFDKDGAELEGRGRDLCRVARIDISGIDSRLKEAKVTVMCDVTNPLCGDKGATRTFGRQKGATPAMEDALEAGMCNYRDVIKRDFGIDCDEIRGGGAAGGLESALCLFCNGEMRSGIETVLGLIRFDERMEGVDLVVPGEGRTDWQSCFGKVMQGVGMHAKNMGVPAIALSGSMGKNAMEQAESLYYEAAIRMFRFIETGIEMGKALREGHSG